jgi:hypothetical protein
VRVATGWNGLRIAHQCDEQFVGVQLVEEQGEVRRSPADVPRAVSDVSQRCETRPCSRCSGRRRRAALGGTLCDWRGSRARERRQPSRPIPIASMAVPVLRSVGRNRAELTVRACSGATASPKHGAFRRASSDSQWSPWKRRQCTRPHLKHGLRQLGHAEYGAFSRLSAMTREGAPRNFLLGETGNWDRQSVRFTSYAQMRRRGGGVFVARHRSLL